jgi:hypothetical protein
LLLAIICSLVAYGDGVPGMRKAARSGYRFVVGDVQIGDPAERAARSGRTRLSAARSRGTATVTEP